MRKILALLILAMAAPGFAACTLTSRPLCNGDTEVKFTCDFTGPDVEMTLSCFPGPIALEHSCNPNLVAQVVYEQIHSEDEDNCLTARGVQCRYRKLAGHAVPAGSTVVQTLTCSGGSGFAAAQLSAIVRYYLDGVYLWSERVSEDGSAFLWPDGTATRRGEVE